MAGRQSSKPKPKPARGVGGDRAGFHDPRYLSADARIAVTRASKSGVAFFAIVLDPSSASVATRIFGAGHCVLLRSLDELPAVVGRIGL